MKGNLSRKEKLKKMVGKRFRTLTRINPSGYIIDHEGNQIDAFSEIFTIEQNEIVLVTKTIGSIGVLVIKPPKVKK